MRSKEEILKELRRDDEKSRERERPSLEGLQVEILVDIRDVIVSLLPTVKVTKTSDHPEKVEVKPVASKKS